MPWSSGFSAEAAVRGDGGRRQSDKEWRRRSRSPTTPSAPTPYHYINNMHLAREDEEIRSLATILAAASAGAMLEAYLDEVARLEGQARSCYADVFAMESGELEEFHVAKQAAASDAAFNLVLAIQNHFSLFSLNVVDVHRSGGLPARSTQTHESRTSNINGTGFSDLEVSVFRKLQGGWPWSHR
ncbi:unnamed protein product [Urochloa humidicola]